MAQLNETIDAMRRRWVEGANLRGEKFPIQTAPPAAMRWDLIPLPDEAVTFPQGVRTTTTAGDANSQAGMVTHIYRATKFMEDERF